jgi:hypothetical protein
MTLQKQVEELKEKSKDNEHIIKGKLEEKDKQILDLRTELTELENMFKGFVNIADEDRWPLFKVYHLAAVKENMSSFLSERKRNMQQTCGYNVVG